MVDLLHLLRALERADVRFVAVGGVAVGVHGYVRMTLDVDVVPDPDRANLERLISLLSRLEATLPSAAGRRLDPALDARVLRRGGNLTLDTPRGGLDIVQRLPGVPPYAELARDAVTVCLEDLSVRVCSLAHLRVMKERAGRAQDLADLAALPDA